MHLTWPPLPPVALRLWASKAIQESCAKVAAIQSASATRAVVQSFWEQARASSPSEKQRWAVPSSAGTQLAPVEGYFARVCAAYRTYLESESLSPEATEVAEVLVQSCQQTICQSCLALTGRSTCAWTAATETADLQNMEEVSLCLTPARELFRECESLARQAYEDLAGVRRDWPVLRFQTALALSANQRLGLAVGGKAGDISEGVRYVRLEFKPDEFELGDYLALPYVLTHECVVHGYCGASLSEDEGSRSIAFHDGWMDSISLKLLAWIPAVGENRVISRYAKDFVSRGESIQNVRNDPFARGLAALTADYDSGVRALQVFSELMALALAGEDVDAEPPNQGMVDHAVLVASLRLNGQALSHLERRDLVAALLSFDFGSSERRLRTYVSPKGGGGHPPRPRLPGRLGRYQAGPRDCDYTRIICRLTNYSCASTLWTALVDGEAMLPKLATFSAALELDTFDLGELAARAGVERPTAQTVMSRLRRAHPEAVEWTRRRTGVPGQPPLAFTLTEDGRSLLQSELRRWTSLSSFSLPDPQPFEPAVSVSSLDAADLLSIDPSTERALPEPATQPQLVGLSVAKRAFDELLASEVDSAGLIPHIRRNLRWARNRLSEEPNRDLEAQCEILEKQVARWERRSEAHQDALEVNAVQAAVDDIGDVPAIEVIPLGGEVGAVEVAEATKMAVADLMELLSKLDRARSFDYCRLDDVHCWVGPSHRSFDQKMRVQLMCVDSSSHPERVRRHLAQWARKPFAGRRLVLDKSRLAVAERHVVDLGQDYFFYCTTQLDWLPRVAAWAQEWFSKLSSGQRLGAAARRDERFLGAASAAGNFSAGAFEEREG